MPNFAPTIQVTPLTSRNTVCFFSFVIFVCILMLAGYYSVLHSLIYYKQQEEVRSFLFCYPPKGSKNLTFRTNIYFAKCHKTAGSTVQNILMRFGLQHSLNFLLPPKDNYLGYQTPIFRFLLDENLIPIDGKYNIFTHHSRYHSKTNDFLYPDTFRLAMLRSPPEHFESMYNFFALEKIYGVKFNNLLASLPYNNTVNFNRKSAFQMSTNQMSFELGFNVNAFGDCDTAIDEFIKHMDKELDFVMLTEYLDASLVLLADSMGWPLHYVSYVSFMNPDLSHKSNLTAEDKIKLSHLNRADALLYDHFEKKFRSRILEYGPGRLLENIQVLQNINEDLINNCITKMVTTGYGGTTSYDWDCVYATKNELNFTDELRTRQARRLKVTRNTLEFIYETRNLSLLLN